MSASESPRGRGGLQQDVAFVEPRIAAGSDPDARARWTDANLRAVWELGREHGLATRIEEIDEARQANLLPPHRSAEERVQERIALFEECYAEFNERLGRVAGYEYKGGPVDWETGMPLDTGGEP